MPITDEKLEEAQHRTLTEYPSAKSWFISKTDTKIVRYFARNVANVAYSARQIYLDKETLFTVPAGRAQPECAVRLKHLLYYFGHVIDSYVDSFCVQVDRPSRDEVEIAKKALEDAKEDEARAKKAVQDLSPGSADKSWADAALRQAERRAVAQSRLSEAVTMAREGTQAKLVMWRAKLGLELEQACWKLWGDPPPMNDRAGSYKAPSESMHELLGQLYIWAELHDESASHRDINGTNGIRDLLRYSVCRELIEDDDTTTLMGTYPSRSTDETDVFPIKRLSKALLERPGQWRKDFQTGVPQTIFASRSSVDNMTWLIGSTLPSYPTTVKSPLKLAREKDRLPVDQLLGRLRDGDIDKLKTLITEIEEKPNRMVDSQKLVNAWMAERRKTVPSWKPFDYTNQTAQAHFLIPGSNLPDFKSTSNWGSVDAGNPECARQYFQPLPRCFKCRIIYNYPMSPPETNTIVQGQPDIVWMNKYASPTAPLQCAEDVVHAKLQHLHPEQNPPTLTTQDPIVKIEYSDAISVPKS